MRIQASKLKRSILLGTILGIVTWIVWWGIVFGLEPIPNTVVKESIADAYFATCELRNQGGIGTGVLLETGYVITAAHNVDVDLNGVVDKKERNVKLVFYTSTGKYPVNGRALYVGYPILLDVAIIELPFQIKSRIKLSKNSPLVGDKLFTIGCSNGGPPHVSFGYESLNSRPLRARASMNAYMGNSGGGIFNEKQELVGILGSIGADMIHIHVRVPFSYISDGKTKKKTATAHVSFKQIIPGWVEYSKSTDIYTYLTALKIPNTVVPPVIKKDYGVFIIYLRMLLHLMGVFACVWFIRKEILG